MRKGSSATYGMGYSPVNWVRIDGLPFTIFCQAILLQSLTTVRGWEELTGLGEGRGEEYDESAGSQDFKEIDENI
jgi:hypothetical protein